ncbi:uncharacterized protein O3C94_016504 [Discoglossus pictus]
MNMKEMQDDQKILNCTMDTKHQPAGQEHSNSDGVTEEFLQEEACDGLNEEETMENSMVQGSLVLFTCEDDDDEEEEEEDPPESGPQQADDDLLLNTSDDFVMEDIGVNQRNLGEPNE